MRSIEFFLSSTIINLLLIFFFSVNILTSSSSLENNPEVDFGDTAHTIPHSLTEGIQPEPLIHNNLTPKDESILLYLKTIDDLYKNASLSINLDIRTSLSDLEKVVQTTDIYIKDNSTVSIVQTYAKRIKGAALTCVAEAVEKIEWVNEYNAKSYNPLYHVINMFDSVTSFTTILNKLFSYSTFSYIYSFFNPFSAVTKHTFDVINSYTAHKNTQLNSFGSEILFLNQSIVSSKGEINATSLVNLFETASVLGNASAQFRMGVFNSYGYFDGTKLNEISTKKALTYYYFSAINGNTLAQAVLAHKHNLGLSVPKSCQSAVLYYEQCANAAVAKVEGYGYESIKDYDRLSLSATGPISVYPSLLTFSFSASSHDQDVIDYFANNADKGDAVAQFRLGQYYFYGIRGAPRDLDLAYKYFKLAATHPTSPDGISLGMLGIMYLKNLVPKFASTPSGQPRNEHNYGKAKLYFEKALNVYERTSNNNNLAGAGIGNNGLGYLYLYGLGVQADIQKAVKYFGAGVDLENAEALHNLGSLYLTGVGVGYIDYNKAVKYFTLALKKGHMLSMHKLAVMHLNGIGLKRSCEAALSFYKLVTEKSDEYIDLITLGKKLYSNQNVEQALQAYLIGAELGSEVAQNNAAFILDKGVRNIYHATKPVYEPSSIMVDDTINRKQPVEDSDKRDSKVVGHDNSVIGLLLDSISNFVLEVAGDDKTTIYQANEDLGTKFLSLLQYMDDGIREGLVRSFASVLGDWVLNVGKLTHGDETALRMLYLAAEQGNIDARVKIGDYYYYRFVNNTYISSQPSSEEVSNDSFFRTSAVNPDSSSNNLEVAAHHYKKAAEFKNSQALFNMGYLYQHGLGVPQDFHLAKRYFDECKDHEQGSHGESTHIPVSLALIWLFLHRVYNYVCNGGNISSFPSYISSVLSLLRTGYEFFLPATNTEAKDKLSKVNDVVLPEIAAGLSGVSDNDGLGVSWKFFDISEVEADTLLLITFILALGIVLWYRNYRQTIRQRNYRNNDESDSDRNR